MIDIIIILLTVVTAVLAPMLTDMSDYGLLAYEAACLGLGGLALILVRRRDARARNSTRLVPGKMPTPPLPDGCDPPKAALLVLWGSNVSWATQMPHTVIQMGDDQMLTIDRAADGKTLVVTVLRIFDERGEIIARLHEDGFWVKNTSRSHRPNDSTLIVYDHNDAEALHVEVLNPTTLSVRGILRHAGFPSIEITADVAKLGGMTLSGNCFGESYVDILVG